MFDLPTYLKRPDALTETEAYQIYQALHPRNADTDEDFATLWAMVLEDALAYAPIRVRWNLQSRAERNAVDAARTAHHNSFIKALQALSRHTTKCGAPDWLKQLGDPAVNRKRIGDFAGYLVLFGVLQGR